MEFLNEKVNKELFYNNSLYIQSQKMNAQHNIQKHSRVVNSIIANGSYIEGTVEIVL